MRIAMQSRCGTVGINEGADNRAAIIAAMERIGPGRIMCQECLADMGDHVRSVYGEYCSCGGAIVSIHADEGGPGRLVSGGGVVHRSY